MYTLRIILYRKSKTCNEKKTRLHFKKSMNDHGRKGEKDREKDRDRKRGSYDSFTLRTQ